MSARRLAAASLTSLVAAFTAVVIGGGTARAHQASATFARIETTGDPARLRYEIRIAARDLYEALGLESDREASPDEIRAGKDRIAAYVSGRLEFDAAGAACRTEPVAVEPVEQGQRFARVELAIVCPAPIRTIGLEYDLFFDLDRKHIGFVAIDGRGTFQLTAPDDTRLEWDVGGEVASGLGGFVVSGVWHILDGLDHILFLLSLLLMAVVVGPTGSSRLIRSHVREGTVRTGKTGGGQGVASRPVRQAITYTGGIVTSFTVAHSFTLIGAALGWFELPSRLVESLIAASIVFVAVDNAIRLDPPRRYLVTFAFGLVHGLGFASMLRPLLPPSEVVMPLLAFNVGVELGQLGLVLVAMPILYLAIRALGAARYRRIVLPLGAVVLGGLGFIWFLERAFAITILGL